MANGYHHVDLRFSKLMINDGEQQSRSLVYVKCITTYFDQLFLHPLLINIIFVLLVVTVGRVSALKNQVLCQPVLYQGRSTLPIMISSYVLQLIYWI